MQKCAVCLLASLTVGSIELSPSFLSPAHASVINPVLSDLSVLISGPPIKDPNALLRYALPIDNKPVKELQKSLEDITDNLKLSGAKAFDPVGRVCELVYFPCIFVLMDVITYVYSQIYDCTRRQEDLGKSFKYKISWGR